MPSTCCYTKMLKEAKQTTTTSKIKARQQNQHSRQYTYISFVYSHAMSSERLKISNFTYIHTYIHKNMYELLIGRTDGPMVGRPVDWIGRSQSIGEGVGGSKTHIGGTIKKIDGHFLDRQTAKKTDGQTLERTDRHTNIRRVFSNSGSCCALL